MRLGGVGINDSGGLLGCHWTSKDRETMDPHASCIPLRKVKNYYTELRFIGTMTISSRGAVDPILIKKKLKRISLNSVNYRLFALSIV